MSHFAELDKDNIVVRVLVGDNNLPNEGLDWFEENLGGRWVQTSYNGTIRKNYAATGYYYDEQRDAFIPPKPYDSWLLDEQTCQWFAPKLRPNDGFTYDWNEANLDWELVNFSQSDAELEA
jgi:hypothetical protein